MRSSPQARIARLVQILHKKILSLLKDNIESIYANSIDMREAYEALHASIPGIVQWFFLCFQSVEKSQSGVALTFKQKEMVIDSIDATEEVLWCPEWGLKGVLDTVCEVECGGRRIKIPVEIKTGSEDPISHNVQLSLYSVMLSQRGANAEFPLVCDGDLSGLLVYLKSDAKGLCEGNNDQSVYEEIKEELMSGRRGSYAARLLLAMKTRAEALTRTARRNTDSALVVREMTMRSDHCRSMLVRRNLLAAYVEKERSRVKEGVKRIEEKECAIEDLVMRGWWCDGLVCESAPSRRVRQLLLL